MKLSEILSKIHEYEDAVEKIHVEIRELKRLRSNDAYKQITRLRGMRDQMRRPVSSGEEAAAKAWERNHTEPVLTRIGNTYAEDYIRTLKENDIQSFFFIGDGGNAFKMMIRFSELGYKPMGVSEIHLDGEMQKGVRFVRMDDF